MSEEEEPIKKELSVFELTEEIKNLIKSNMETVCVVGEISNWKLSKTNVFFTLKDEGASINSVIWNYSNKKNKEKLDDGSKVKITGSLTVFTKSGTYNLVVQNIELLGTGDLHTQYIKLKDNFEKRGYFNPDKKKKLPNTINKIGIITSTEGAALQDFLYVLNKNNFMGTVYIKHAIVQGKDCPKSVCNGLHELDKMGLDVIIIARGGGSFEDLFGFSDPLILEELYKTKTCTISAVGHEVDFMLSDLVADIRAPTPSIAGQMVSKKDNNDITLDKITEINNRLISMIDQKSGLLKHNLLTVKLQPLDYLMDKKLKEIDLSKQYLGNLIAKKINLLEQFLNNTTANLNSMDNPAKVLANGYTVLYDQNNRKIAGVHDFHKYIITEKNTKKLKLIFMDGEVIFNVTSIKTKNNNDNKDNKDNNK